MAKISIVYWSGTGNTEAMANLIAEGAKAAGADVTVKSVSDASPADVLEADVALLGCAAMGDEVLEEGEFEPFVEGLEGSVSGKKLGLFGSYGWGDGEWMRQWYARMQGAGASLLDEGLIVNEAPDAEGEAACRAFGEKAAAF